MIERFKVVGHKPQTPRHDKKKGKSDSADVQISVSAEVPKGSKLAREVIEQAIRYRAINGLDPEGFKIKLIRWRNPDRGIGTLGKVHTNATSARGSKGWREYGTQADRFGSLARLLQLPSMVYTVTSDRPRGRKIRRKKPANRRRPRKKGRRK